jgi:hypothetical protein
MQNVSLVVAERGADWLGWARHLRRGTTSTIVLAQNAGEDDAEFAERVSLRIARLRQKGALVEQAAFVVGEQAARTQHRPGLLRKLSTLLGRRDAPTHLYLDPSAEPTQGAQRMMRALAMALSELAGGSGLSISVGAHPCETAAECGAA